MKHVGLDIWGDPLTPHNFPLFACMCVIVHVSSIHVYTEDAGLPYFDRAAVIANGNWYYVSALESMGATLCFRYCLVNIGPRYK